MAFTCRWAKPEKTETMMFPTNLTQKKTQWRHRFLLLPLRCWLVPHVNRTLVKSLMRRHKHGGGANPLYSEATPSNPQQWVYI